MEWLLTSQLISGSCSCVELTYTMNALEMLQAAQRVEYPAKERYSRRSFNSEYSIKHAPCHATLPVGHTPVLSHNDMQTSIRFSQTVDPSPPPLFDDLQHRSYRIGNPQPAPRQSSVCTSIMPQGFWICKPSSTYCYRMAIGLPLID